MRARILTTAMFAGVFAGVLPAADSQMLGLVMPDAKVVAGVNAAQAKNSPFGQYVLGLAHANDAEFQKLIAQTGFDPTRDVTEVLAATNGTPNTGLALARGTFDVASITAFATQQGGLTEMYQGATILEDPKQTHGIAFLNSTLVAAGDLASVKAAIGRQTVPAALPAALTSQVNQWSTTQDAWVVTTVPPSTLHQVPNAPEIPGVGANAAPAFQNIQQAGAGVKLGAMIVVTAQAQAATAQDATQMAGALQMLVSFAQLQVSKTNPQQASMLNALSINAQGNLLNITASLPQDQLQQLIKQGPAAQREHRVIRKM